VRSCPRQDLCRSLEDHSTKPSEESSPPRPSVLQSRAINISRACTDSRTVVITIKIYVPARPSRFVRDAERRKGGRERERERGRGTCKVTSDDRVLTITSSLRPFPFDSRHLTLVRICANDCRLSITNQLIKEALNNCVAACFSRRSHMYA